MPNDTPRTPKLSDSRTPESREETPLEKWLAESRKLNTGCGCQLRGTRQFNCSYHEGAMDGWEAGAAESSRLRKRVEELEAEEGKLRAALAKIEEAPAGACTLMRKIARAALIKERK
jgi:hypothetical protein